MKSIPKFKVHCRKCNNLYARYSRWTKLCDNCWTKASHDNGVRVGKLGKKHNIFKA